MVLQMPDGTDMDALATRLDDLGYDGPTPTTGVWRGGADLVAGIDPSISPELQNVVIDRDRHLVVSSDDPDYAASVAKVARGDAARSADTELAPLAAERSRSRAPAFLWTGGFACAGPLDVPGRRRRTEQRATGWSTAAGGVDPLDGLVMSLDADGRLQVGARLRGRQAGRGRTCARARSSFVGPAPGRGRAPTPTTSPLTRSRTDGSAVLLDLRPRRTGSAPLTAISQGPVLFATC